MEKTYSKISVPVPEGFYPSKFEVKGGYITIFLAEKIETSFDIGEITTPPNL